MDLTARADSPKAMGRRPLTAATFFENKVVKKWLRIMKLTTILLIAATMHVAAAGNAQKVTLNVKNVPLKTVFVELNKQTGYNFLYSDEALAGTDKVTIKVKDASIEDVLSIALKNQPLEFSMVNNTIVVKPKERSGQENQEIASLRSQLVDVKGRVVNEAGEPVVGASVMVKGTKIGTTTNANGEFQLNGVDENAVLVVSGVSIEPIEIVVAKNPGLKSGDGLTITTKTEITTLNEVTVNKGYYTEKRAISTSNTYTVASKEIGKQPVSNPLLALYNVPGMFITQSTGLPGSGVTVRIQGQNSIVKGNDPLYIIDGVPYTSQLLPNSGSILGSSGSNPNGNPFSFINPADIESIDILKDADATAIYGSRAANGAILITTKKGRSGKTRINVNVQSGWGSVTRKLDVLNTRQFLDMRYEAIKNDGQTITTASNLDLRLWDTTRHTDWQKELIGNKAHYTDVQTTVSGGNANTQFLIGGGYHRETTVFPGEMADQKGSLHFSINNHSENQKFKIQLSGNYLLDDNRLITQDFTRAAIQLSPNAPAGYNPDGSINWAINPATGNASWENPYNYVHNKYKNKTSNLISNAVLSYQVLPGLHIQSALGYTNLQSNEIQTFLLISVQPSQRPTSSRIATFGNNNINTWIIEPQANYKRKIGNGTLEALLGMTIQKVNSSGQLLRAVGFNSDLVIEDIKSATTVTINSNILSVYKYNAGFGRVNYNWSDKYIVNLTARRDGSSRFGPENQFHNFYSVGGAWIFSKEKFMQESFPFLSFGKIRGSYGTTGNDQIGDYLYLNRYSSISAAVPFQGANGLTPIELSNPYLQWEETKKLQFGLDLGFLNDRIILNANYYTNRSSNQLLDYALPVTTGFYSIARNFPATVQNTGWEFSLNTINLKTKNLNWTSNVNLTLPRNKLIDFPNIESSSYASSLVVGQPISMIKVYRFAGVNSSTGIYEFGDGKGNVTTRPDTAQDITRSVLINTFPKFYGGFQNTFTYKGIQLDILFQFVKQVGPNYLFGGYPGDRNGGQGNQPITVLSRWQNPGDISRIQRFNSNFSLQNQVRAFTGSDAAYSDASYIRLKNLSLSYQLPEKWRQKIHMQNCRIYVQGQNLLTFTKYQGLDPETRSSVTLPPLRVVTIGVQITL